MERWGASLFVSVSIALAVAAGAAGGLLHYEIGMLGYPDGHLSAEQLLVKPRLRFLEITAWLVVCCFFVAIYWRGSPKGKLAAACATLTLIGLLLATMRLGFLPSPW